MEIFDFFPKAFCSFWTSIGAQMIFDKSMVSVENGFGFQFPMSVKQMKNLQNLEYTILKLLSSSSYYVSATSTNDTFEASRHS